MADRQLNFPGGTATARDGKLLLTADGNPVGAANVAVTQVSASTTAATLVAARPTRTGVTIRNQDASISVYIGPATVSAANGLLLKAGESLRVTWVGLIQVIAASGTPSVGCWDEYT